MDGQLVGGTGKRIRRRNRVGRRDTDFHRVPGLPLRQQRVPELNGGGARQKLVVGVPAGGQRAVRGQPPRWPPTPPHRSRPKFTHNPESLFHSLRLPEILE
ncbi:hypothetical protein [Micromonospora rubida]|uniref:hypothetical protein n=1 Tax=Micromonospora rubida TaxID=2697657 RepID=UPI001379112D|nr:hypothetical protein [Micromonospora rubida]NBE82758.1 hypothetical protein [Micromonospora rubida]